MVTGSHRLVITIALLAIVSASAFAAKISDIKNTRHNLSTSGPGTVKATSESQICVFCHTPHKAQAIPGAPLWNRKLSSTTYTTYTSESMDATLAQPDGSSKLCLSCHDGTMALGSVGVLNGQENATIAMSGTGAGNMPDGAGAATGYTRDLGTTLTNDHPISFTYDSGLATTDGELVDPAATTYIKNRTPGATHPDIPLENGKVQCVACHDPHIRDTDLAKNAKFLRLNRFQENVPNGGTFSAADDQVCLACHDKDKAGWSGSAHANPAVATQTYQTNPAKLRDFDAALPVWKAACLNCHDTHTVQGARRLLREGTDGPTVADPNTGLLVKNGGNPALEETCYQCHDGGATGPVFPQGSVDVLNSYATVPNIKRDFGLSRHMPITSTDQNAGNEVHAITDKDFTESQLNLGKGDLNNRHAECTDCHNPHRVIKNRLFNANPAVPDAAGTHEHTAGVVHTNIASGVLAGTTGVEPDYGATTTWGVNPANGYVLKKGVGISTAAASSHVTREYQICLKCHSDYAWTTPPATSKPYLSLGSNGVTQYTNQAMEFQAPPTHQGEPTIAGFGMHRSWHPVMDATGRDTTVRWNMTPANFTAPWSSGIGTQTMYCSDCHGSDTTVGSKSVVPVGGEDGEAWGPHGSTNNFILKGKWDPTTASAPPAGNELCFKCHDWNAYSNVANATVANSALWKSGFGSVASTAMGCTIDPTISANNLHLGHRLRIGKELRCSWCHTAVPHGWKNKALLVDISQEPLCAGTGVNNVGCNVGPYYQNAMLGGGGAVLWKASGQWAHSDCGGANGFASWMGASCNNPP